MTRKSAMPPALRARVSQKKRGGEDAQALGQTPMMPLSPPVTSVH